MFRWTPVAMVRIALFFAAGTLAGIHFPCFVSTQDAVSLLIALLISYGSLFLGLKGTRFIKGISGAVGICSIIILGYVNAQLADKTTRADHLANASDSIDFVIAEVAALPEARARSFRIELHVRKVRSVKGWRNATGKVLLYVLKTKNVPYRYGDKLLIKGKPALIDGPMHPGDIDFRKILFFRGITHQIFVDTAKVAVLSLNASRGFIYYSQQVRMWASDRIKLYVQGDQERVIARALILGVTDGLDNELRNAYAASGAMHILSVSGLHVGIIYAVVIFLLRPFAGRSWSKWWIAGVSLVLLWAYAFVTGLSPSVLRAVTMFSFIVIAKPFARDTNIYNTLAASAFLLLMYQPFLIMSVGFQLSYLAVVGILWFYPLLYAMWEPESWILDKGWQLICVSLAAQSATFIVGFYYFNQFPVYFLLSNLLVVPLSSLILLVGILLIAVSGVVLIATAVGSLLYYSIVALNMIVVWIEGLPGSVVTSVHISAFQVWILMGMMVALVCFIESKRIRWVYTLFVFGFIFGISRW